MKIVVYGAGAVGTWYGGHLKKAGADVIFVARGKTYDRLKQSPIELRSPQSTVLIDAPVTHTITNADLLIIAAKTLGAVDLPDLSDPTTVVMTTQNSVEMPSIAIEKYGANRVIPAVVRGFFTKVAPGITAHDGNIQSLTFGSIHSDTQNIVAELAALLAVTPIIPCVKDDILADVWVKAMFVSPFGALGAVFNQPLGVLRTTYRDSLRALIDEAATTARAHHINLPADIVDQTLTFADEQDPASTTSMQRDILDGKSNELDAQVGAIIRMANRVAVPVPLHQLIVEILTARQQ
ncbi:MAG: 2-dehydropantoate 2-reductase [Corynebacterium sp.]|nr:2-dehydropantoate 2-reductase [Corynebacterium sp.]